MNEQEFLDQYMKPRTGIYAKARVFGASRWERDIVEKYHEDINNKKANGDLLGFNLPENKK